MLETIGALIDRLVAAPTGSVLVLAGIVFLLIAVVGNVSGKIEPGPIGRIAGGAIGVALLAGGLTVFSTAPTTGPVRPTGKTTVDRPAPDRPRGSGQREAGVCGAFIDGIFSDDREQRLKSQASLIQLCASDRTAVSLLIEKAHGNMDNRAGVYDALSFLDKVPDGEMRDPGLRQKIRDFAVAAAGQGGDIAVLSKRLEARYR